MSFEVGTNIWTLLNPLFIHSQPQKQHTVLRGTKRNYSFSHGVKLHSFILLYIVLFNTKWIFVIENSFPRANAQSYFYRLRPPISHLHGSEDNSSHSCFYLFRVGDSFRKKWGVSFQYLIVRKQTYQSVLKKKKKNLYWPMSYPNPQKKWSTGGTMCV